MSNNGDLRYFCLKNYCLLSLFFWSKFTSSWSIGHEKTKGNSMGFAGLKQDVQNLHNSTHWFLTWGNKATDWKKAGKMLKVNGEDKID